MLGYAIIYLLIGAAVFLSWYSWFVRYNRKKSLEILRWIETALAGKGHVVAIRWMAPSRFEVALRLGNRLFQKPSLQVQLMPRETPLSWIVNRLKKRQETATFEADLEAAPAANLQVHTHRWCGRTRKSFSPDPRHWVFEQAGPFVLTTRRDWQREVTAMMNSLISTREREVINVAFRRSSPHFTATVPLEALSPQADDQSRVFEMLNEIAAGISPSHF